VLDFIFSLIICVFFNLFALLTVSMTISICSQCLYIILNSFKLHLEIVDFSHFKYFMTMTLIFNVLEKKVEYILILEENNMISSTTTG
jgi:hypothetical protein